MARSGGRIPKRSTERRRRNLDGKPETVEATGTVRVPSLPQDTHPIARRWYRSLRESGQSQYFEPSDWAAALVVAKQMTDLFNAGPLSGEKFTSLWAAMNDLLTTEASRRRARIEIERAVAQEEVPPGVTAMEEFRRRMEAQA